MVIEQQQMEVPLMAMNVRRIVVSNDSTGTSRVTRDEVLEAETVSPSLPIAGTELWVTDQMPVDNTLEAEEEQQQGSLSRFHNLYVRNGQGSAFRITEIPAGTPAVFHRTESVDYDVILSGEVDLVLDDDQRVHMKAGDTAIVRGALHAWSNTGSEPVVLAYVMIDAAPVVVGGKTLAQHYPKETTS